MNKRINGKNDLLGWIILLLILLLIGFLLPRVSGKTTEQLREEERQDNLIPPNIAQVWKCGCRMYRWLQDGRVVYTLVGRVFYLSGGQKVKTLKVYRQHALPKTDEKDCEEWFMLVRQAYHEETHILKVEKH